MSCIGLTQNTLAKNEAVMQQSLWLGLRSLGLQPPALQLRPPMVLIKKTQTSIFSEDLGSRDLWVVMLLLSSCSPVRSLGKLQSSFKYQRQLVETQRFINGAARYFSWSGGPSLLLHTIHELR